METASCQVCEKGKAEVLKLSFCSSCLSVSYCSRACQKADWKAHKNICKNLNVGDAKQTVHPDQQARAQRAVEVAERALSESHPTARRFFRLFLKSKGDTDHTVTIREMKKVLLKVSPYNRQTILFNSLSVLLVQPTSEMLELPTSPLKVVLQSVDANAMMQDVTPLHWVAEMSNQNKESTLENQCILAKQLIEAGANVNARVHRCLGERTPLHSACYGRNCTNLNFIQLLLDNGANPNAKDSDGATPLYHSLPDAPGAAKFMLTYSDETDPDILANDGRSFLAMVRSGIVEGTSKARRPNNPDSKILLFQVKQWQEVEKLLVKRGALDNGWRRLDY
jgi:hypothetical protein